MLAGILSLALQQALEDSLLNFWQAQARLQVEEHIEH